MNTNLHELIKDVFNSSFKSKNIKLQLILDDLECSNNDVQEHVFELVDLLIYCLSQDKMVEIKK